MAEKTKKEHTCRAWTSRPIIAAARLIGPTVRGNGAALRAAGRVAAAEILGRGSKGDK